MQNSAQLGADNFLQYFSFGKNKIIAGYYPIDNELDCLVLLKKLHQYGHSICLPIVKAQNKPMIFKQWQRGEKLIDGAYNIKIPSKNAPIIKPDIIIMPLVAYDKNGNRLGYGKGYYDRTIVKMDKRPILIGYGYKMQQVEHIEHQSHDVPLDYIVNEKQVRRF